MGGETFPGGYRVIVAMFRAENRAVNRWAPTSVRSAIPSRSRNPPAKAVHYRSGSIAMIGDRSGESLRLLQPLIDRLATR